MNRRIKILIIVIVAIILIFLLILKISSKNRIESEKEIISTTTDYNQEESIYRVIDDKTGEILYEGTSEADAYLYEIDPSYRPSNPDSIEEFEIIDGE